MEKYEIFDEQEIQKLKRVYFQQYIWAYKNEVSWFILICYDDNKCRFCPVDYLTCNGSGLPSYRKFSEAIFAAKDRMDNHSELDFELYQFDGFEEFVKHVEK